MIYRPFVAVACRATENVDKVPDLVGSDDPTVFTAATVLEAVAMATNSHTTSETESSVSPGFGIVTSHTDAAQPIGELSEPKSEKPVEAAGAAKFNRRSIMNMMVSAAALASVLPMKTEATLADPIFAAMDAHKVAKAAFI